MRKTPTTRSVLSCCAALLAWAPALSVPAGGQIGGLLPVPRPDLDAMEPIVRHEIVGLAAAFEDLRLAGAAAEELGEASGRLGGVYHAHEFHLAAEVAYRNARTLAPRAPRWAYYLGLLYQDLGRLEEAAVEFGDVLAVRPGDLASLIRCGDLQLRLDRPREARRFFERALAAAPGSAAALEGLGRSAAATGDLAAAARHFEKALELQPGPSTIHYGLAQVYRKLGDRKRARLHLELRGDRRAEFPDPLLDQLARIPKVSAANVLLAQAEDPAIPARELSRFALAHLGETPGAALYLTAAVGRREAGATPDEPLVRARIHLAIAALLVRTQADGEAIEHLRTASRLAPGLFAARLELAATQARMGRQAEAVEHYTEALRIDPDSRAALGGRAATWVRLGNDEVAAADFRRLIEIAGDQGEPRLHLAMLLRRSGEPVEAEEHFRRALELGLGAGDETLARGQLATLLQQRGEPEEALEHLEAAWHLQPDSPDLELRLADALGLADRFDEAAERYAHVVAGQLRNQAARIGEISALIFARRWPDARRRLEDGHRAVPESRVLSHLLARFLAVAPAESLRDGERALALAREIFAYRQTLLHGETVAMALAQTGRFREAADLQGSLLKAAVSRGAERAAARLRANLDLYLTGRRCCVEQGFAVLLPTADPGTGS